MKPTILYVDDEEANLRGFRSVFRRDYNVLVAPSGEEALKVLDENKCDIVITDQRMPKMTGVELLKEIFKRFPKIPPGRMILSGYSKSEDIEEARKKYKLSAFVSKPWNAKDLKEKIEKILHDVLK